MKPAISIVIVTWNAEAVLSDCLASVRREAGPHAEVIVSDNASTDRTIQVARAADAHAIVLLSSGNEGFAVGANRGLACAHAERILLLNPDARLLEGSLAALRAALERDPRCGVAGPALIDSGGRLDPYSARNLPRLRDRLFEGLFLTRLLGTVPPFDHYLIGRWDHETPRDVPCLSGACLLLRREVYELAGGFDERFFLFQEDVEWCARVASRGYLLHYEPAARVFHIAHTSLETDLLRSYRSLLRSDRLLFHQVWRTHRRIAVDLVWIAISAVRLAVYSVLSLPPVTGRRYRRRPLVFLRLLGDLFLGGSERFRSRAAASHDP